MKIVLVAAIGENNVIGRDGQLPWRLKSDLAHFRKLTIDKPVVMGRKTFQSIGRALDRRTNIVITRDATFAAPGVLTAASFPAALDLARKDAVARGTDEIMIVGGSDIFAASLPLADRLEITHVRASPEGDVTFPPIDPTIWREVSRTEHAAGPQDDASFAVAAYLRR
ncbi:MAG: dihydrofolate reductase [Rhizobiales bacterium]|jgi:dihydrofolate reductase|nr:dihydrofolate reductase [Hyphomicrobiales bacterium]